MSGARRAARGLTLIELLIASLMSTVVIAGAVSLFLAQHRSFRAGSSERSIQEGARVALEEVAGNLRRAGYGVDPSVAFDFGLVAAGWLENTTPAGTLAPGEALGASVQLVAPADCTNPVTCRDSIAGPDELVFRYRSPYFGPHPLAATPTAAQLTLTGGVVNPLPAGQELLVICYGAEPRVWAYVTVGTAVPAMDPASPPPTTPVTLEAGTRDFPRQNALLGHACFTRTGNDAPRVFRVERLRYFIRRFADAGGPQRPYLMVARGNSADAAAEPVAPDVEDLQVAYVFPFLSGRTPGGTASPDRGEIMVGNVAGTALSSGAGAIDLASAFPTYADARLLTSDPTTGVLANETPSNIRAVRLALVVRSPVADSPVDTVMPASLNRPAGTPALPANERRFRRFLIESTVFLPNMTAVHSYAPYYRTQSTAPGSLAGGG